MATKNKYTINQDLRTVTFVFGSLDDNAKKEVAELQSYGYTIVAEAPKKRKAVKGISYDEMTEYAKGKPFEEELAAKISAKENFMKVKKWFLERKAEFEKAAENVDTTTDNTKDLKVVA